MAGQVPVMVGLGPIITSLGIRLGVILAITGMLPIIVPYITLVIGLTTCGTGAIGMDHVPGPMSGGAHGMDGTIVGGVDLTTITTTWAPVATMAGVVAEAAWAPQPIATLVDVQVAWQVHRATAAQAQHRLAPQDVAVADMLPVVAAATWAAVALRA